MIKKIRSVRVPFHEAGVQDKAKGGHRMSSAVVLCTKTVVVATREVGVTQQQLNVRETRNTLGTNTQQLVR